MPNDLPQINKWVSAFRKNTIIHVLEGALEAIGLHKTVSWKVSLPSIHWAGALTIYEKEKYSFLCLVVNIREMGFGFPGLGLIRGRIGRYVGGQ